METLKSIARSLDELEGDGSLGRRIRATQELAGLLESVGDDDVGVMRLCDSRGVPSLLVALMDVCGEERAVTRNTILATLSRLVFYVDGGELLQDTRLWALLLRMLYQRDETSVCHALTAVFRMSLDESCLTRQLCESRRLAQLTEQLAASENDKISSLATTIAYNVAQAHKMDDANASATFANAVENTGNAATSATSADAHLAYSRIDGQLNVREADDERESCRSRRWASSSTHDSGSFGCDDTVATRNSGILVADADGVAPLSRRERMLADLKNWRGQIQPKLDQAFELGIDVPLSDYQAVAAAAAVAADAASYSCSNVNGGRRPTKSMLGWRPVASSRGWRSSRDLPNIPLRGATAGAAGAAGAAAAPATSSSGSDIPEAVSSAAAVPWAEVDQALTVSRSKLSHSSLVQTKAVAASCSNAPIQTLCSHGSPLSKAHTAPLSAVVSQEDSASCRHDERRWPADFVTPRKGGDEITNGCALDSTPLHCAPLEQRIPHGGDADRLVGGMERRGSAAGDSSAALFAVAPIPRLACGHRMSSEEQSLCAMHSCSTAPPLTVQLADGWLIESAEHDPRRRRRLTRAAAAEQHEWQFEARKHTTTATIPSGTQHRELWGGGQEEHDVVEDQTAVGTPFELPPGGWCGDGENDENDENDESDESDESDEELDATSFGREDWSDPHAHDGGCIAGDNLMQRSFAAECSIKESSGSLPGTVLTAT